MALNAFDVGFAISVFDRASGPLNRIRSSYRTLNLETQKYEKRMMAGFKLLAGGYIAAASGIAAMGGALKLAQKSADFQLQIDQLKVVAAQSGLAENKLSGLRATVQQVASATTFSVTDITKASKTFLQRGLTDVGLSGKGLKGAAVFSEISLGQIDIVKSSEIAAQGIKAFRKSGESDMEAMNRTLGVMANVANTTSLTFDKLPLTMGRIARAGSISGLSLEELSVAVGRATDTMGSYRIAGTSVAVLFEQLAKEGKEKKLLKMLGLEGARVKDVGFVKVIDALRDKMDATGTSADDMAVKIAANLKIGAKNVQILTGAAKAAQMSGESFGSFVRNAAEAGDKGLAFLEQIVERKYYDTLGGQLKLLEGKFENFQINLGTTFAPALESIARVLGGKGGLFDTINAFLTNPSKKKQLVDAAESFLKGAFISAVTGITALVTGAVLLVGPIIAPMIPIMVAMGAAVSVIVNNLAESFGGFKKLTVAIADAARVLISGDDAFLGDKTSDRFNNANRVVKTLSSSFEFLKGVFEGIMVVIKPLVSLVEALVGGLKSLAGVFGGEGGPGGAGKILGQVLMGGLLFKGAGKFLGLGGGAAAAMGGGAAAAMGGGAARGALAGGAARGVASRRGMQGRLSGSLFGMGAAAGTQSLAARGTFDTNPAIGGKRMMWVVPDGGGLGSAVKAPASAKMRATSRRNAVTRLGQIKGRAAGTRMAGGAGIAGAVGGAALGQMLSPDNELVQLGAMLAVQAGATAAAPSIGALGGSLIARAGVGLGSAGLGGLISGGSVTAAIGGAGAGAATAATAGLVGLVAAVGGATFAITRWADESLGFTDWLSDEMAGVDSTKDRVTRGVVAGGLKNVDIFGKDGKLSIDEKSKKEFFARTGKAGQLAFAQREAGVNKTLARLDSIVSEEMVKVTSGMSRQELRQEGATGRIKEQARQNLMKANDPAFQKALDNFNIQEQLFKQLMENNQLLTHAQQAQADRVVELTNQGINTARATEMAANAIAGANFKVMIDGKMIGNAVVEVNTQINAEATTEGSDLNPLPVADVGLGGFK
jgi:TP901 family phage tail tape measure protein